jgi:hypothetical protein
MQAHAQVRESCVQQLVVCTSLDVEYKRFAHAMFLLHKGDCAPAQCIAKCL